MADLLAVADAQRAAVLAQDRAVSAELVRVYGQTYVTIRQQLKALTDEIEAARKRGETVNVGWLAQRDRLDSLRGQVEREINRFADTADGLITSQQQTFVFLAREHVEAQALASVSSPSSALQLGFNRLPTGAVQELVGVLADGSPLRDLLGQLGPSGAKTVSDGLLQGVALGKGTGQIARDIRAGLGGNLARAQRISRSEVIRSYRESGRQTALANREILSGWRWLSARNRRTCASCLAAHGSVHPVTERLNDHVMGRCTQLWIVRGIPAPDLEPGEQWFARQSEATQAAILGPSKLSAYHDGKITLQDLHGDVHSARWGRSHPERSLREVLGEKAAREYVRGALAAAA